MLQEKLLERARAKKQEMANMRNVERVWEFFQHPAHFFVELVVRALLPRTLSCLEHVQLRQAVDKLDVFWLLLRRYICMCGDICTSVCVIKVLAYAALSYGTSSGSSSGDIYVCVAICV